MNIPIINGLSEIKDAFDGFIIDLWGVVFEGDEPYDGAIEALKSLKQEGKKIIFLTNSSRRSEIVKAILTQKGLSSDLYDGLLSSGEIIHYELKKRKNDFFKHLGKNYYHLGPDRPTGLCEGLDYTQVKDISLADFVLETGPIYDNSDIESYYPLLRSCYNRNLPMVCCNPDRLTLKDGRVIIGSGSIALMYEKMGGRVCYRGKPSPDVFLYCFEGIGVEDKNKILVIGDTFNTDIAGADEAGFHSLLVARGIHARELGVSAGTKPSQEKVNELARIYGLFPLAVVPSFSL